MNAFFKTVAVTAVAAAALMGGTAVQAEGERYVLVSHAPDSDSWWNTIKNGLALAGEQMGVEVEYRNPPTGDLADMARIIEQAAASGPDGIITTLADPDVLSGPIQAAVDAGIDVVIINSGTPAQARELGALMYVGQPEYDAGFAAGQRAAGDGVESFLCVNHYISSPSSTERCQGFADGLGVELGNQMIDSGQDPSEIQNRVMAYLNTNSDTDAILTLGPTSADPTILALEELGLAGDIYFRHLRSGRQHRAGSARRRDPVGHRPAALPAGVSADHRAVELPPLRRSAGQQHQLRPRLRDRRRAGDGRDVRGRIPLIT
jgi:simple sugar transport system substrate-binding protein